jgi:hypothetical protein
LAWLGGALLLFVLFRVALVGPHDRWFRYTSPPGEAWAAQYVQHAVLGNQIELLGFDLPQSRVRAGETLSVVLYWRALRPLGVNYQAFVHLMTDPASVSWGQSDALNPGSLPTERWPLDRYVWDTHQVAVRPETPPGAYGLQVGLYTLGDGQRLPVIGPDGTAVGQSVTLNVPVQVLEVGSRK